MALLHDARGLCPYPFILLPSRLYWNFRIYRDKRPLYLKLSGRCLFGYVKTLETFNFSAIIHRLLVFVFFAYLPCLVPGVHLEHQLPDYRDNPEQQSQVTLPD